MNLKRADVDLEIAKNYISAKGNPTNDEYFYDASAYHTQQAIEKNLKYILHDIFKEDDTTKSFRTHNIASLILKVQKHDFIIDDDLINMSAEITDWEATSRYGGNTVANIKDIKKAIEICERLHNQIKNYEKEKNIIIIENNITKRISAKELQDMIISGQQPQLFSSSNKKIQEELQR